MQNSLEGMLSNSSVYKNLIHTHHKHLFLALKNIV